MTRTAKAIEHLQAAVDENDTPYVIVFRDAVADVLANMAAALAYAEAERAYEAHAKSPHPDAYLGKPCPECQALWHDGVVVTKRALLALLPSPVATDAR